MKLFLWIVHYFLLGSDARRLLYRRFYCPPLPRRAIPRPVLLALRTSAVMFASLAVLPLHPLSAFMAFSLGLCAGLVWGAFERLALVHI